MNKKVVIAAAVVLLVIGIITGWFFVRSSQKQEPVSPLSGGEESIKKTQSSKLKEYTDSAGFTFSYPEDLKVVNNQATDSATYSDLKLTSSDASGSISIKITDSKVKSLDELKFTGVSKEIKLANIPAREVKTDDRLTAAALDQGILFTIEVLAKNEDEFWSSVYKTLLSTFAFSSPETSTSSTTTGGSGEDVTFEGEEIVE